MLQATPTFGRVDCAAVTRRWVTGTETSDAIELL